MIKYIGNLKNSLCEIIASYKSIKRSCRTGVTHNTKYHVKRIDNSGSKVLFEVIEIDLLSHVQQLYGTFSVVDLWENTSILQHIDWEDMQSVAKAYFQVFIESDERLSIEKSYYDNKSQQTIYVVLNSIDNTTAEFSLHDLVSNPHLLKKFTNEDTLHIGFESGCFTALEQANLK